MFGLSSENTSQTERRMMQQILKIKIFSSKERKDY